MNILEKIVFSMLFVFIIVLIYASIAIVWRSQFNRYYIVGQNTYFNMYYNDKQEKKNEKKELELKLLKLQIKKLENER